MPEALSGNALQMTSAPSRSVVAFGVTLPVSGQKGDTFVMGGWVNAKSVAEDTNNNERKNAPCIAYVFVNGSTGSGWKYLDFSREWVGWQYGSWPVVAPSAYTEIRISINYPRNAQTAMFSNMFVHREQYGESFAYDDKKNLLSVANLSETKSSMKYDSFDNLTEYVQPGAASTEKYVMTYGTTDAEKKRHLLRSSTTPMGIKQTYEYDAYGNQTQASTTGKINNVEAAIKVQTDYNNGDAENPLPAGVKDNYVYKEWDARGNAVTKTVDPETYTLTSVTDPTGQAVNYTYDAAHRVTQVESVAGGKTYKNSYTYENDRIKTVSHNTTSNTSCDVTYTFNYDSLGRKTSVKVGSQTLSTNVYENDRSGMLKEVQYGNGGKVGYEYDEYDRLTGVKYDGEATPRYTYEYGANGQAMRVEDKNLNRVQQVEYDLAERPMQKTIRDLNTEELIYRTTLQYDGKNRLKDFSEQTAEGSHRTSYTYDKDDRTTAIQYDDAEHKVEYTYDALNRITSRKVTNGEQVYETTYGYVAGNTTKYGAGATTPLIASITQGADANAMNFAYTYDSRGNITSETRNGKKTTYSYDALGQLIRVNDPHENATWVYNYDRGGNITSKVKYAYTTGTLGTAQQTIPYTYGDANWKDKLTAYNGKTITYDAIGNPLNDGERKYTWSAGRQLKKVALPATVSESMNTTDGVDAGSNARLKIVFSNSNVLQNSSAKTTASAHVYVGTEEITANIPVANFTWVKVAENGTVTQNWKKGVKSVSLTQADLSGATEIRCEVTRTSEYGTVQVNNEMMASHTPAVDDANDKFSIENGNLMLNTTDTENLYKIENNCLKVEAGLGVNLTAKAVVYPKLPDKVVEFKYNTEGIRTQKKVILPNGKSTTTEYILHGKQITEMQKGEEVLHFYYDAASKPTSVKYNGKVYTYVKSLQGDIVGILDSAGSLVVEYKYDAWGRLLSTTGTLASTLGKNNPFRYRGYVYDEEIKLYYLRSRYYSVDKSRFVNSDEYIGKNGDIFGHNTFVYCKNMPVHHSDPSGNLSGIINGIKEIVLFIGGILIAAYTSVCGAIDSSNIKGSWDVATDMKMAAMHEAAVTRRIYANTEASYELYRDALLNGEYYLAYSSHGKLIIDDRPMSIDGALITLGFTSGINSYMNQNKILELKKGEVSADVAANIPEYAISQGEWGIYTPDKLAAEGLAFMFGGVGKAEISMSMDSAYYHYHDQNRAIHIWFGMAF